MRRLFDAAVQSLPTAERGTETVLTGTLLTLGCSVAPVLGVALLGYAVRVARSASGADTALPAFEGWADILSDGVRAALATLPLHLPGAAVFAFVVGVDRTRLVAPSLFFTLRDGVFPALDLLVGVLAVVALEIAAGYLSVAALVAVARRGSLGVSLAETTLEIARDGAFARAFSFALAVGTVGHVLRGVVGAVPLLGELASAAVAFVALVVGASLVGRATPSVGRLGGRATGGQTTDIPFDATPATPADGVRE